MSTEPMNNGVLAFEQEPPIVKNLYVQKLETLEENENNLILRIEYHAQENLPEVIDLFNSGIIACTIKDNGESPDLEKGDRIYSTSIHIDIPKFINEIQANYEIVEAQGGLSVFEGHVGKFISSSEVEQFDLQGFNNYATVQIYQPILNVANCVTSILKQNSLFITDLSVVEDPARTYNIYDDIGNPTGAWTFGTLIKNMTNFPTTGITPHEFLKRWVKTWTENQMVGALTNVGLGYEDVLARTDVVFHLIGPWLKKAYSISNPGSSFTMPTLNNWEASWDAQTNEVALLQSAPFRLMAIVNRLDLRGNSSYGGLTNTGETRFIFTLIDPTTGKPAFHRSIHFPVNPPQGAIDWVGMNVILEYGNPQLNQCQLLNFAQQWFDLSSFPLGIYNNPNDVQPNEDYNGHLQDITDRVTAIGAGGTKVNGSAINQIRTNEKLFPPISNGAVSLDPWTRTDWELRQFELDDDGYLVPTSVTNTPIDEKDLGFFSMNQSGNLGLSTNNTGLNLMNWIYGSSGTSINRIRASLGNHNIPFAYLGGSARIYKEFMHGFGLDWENAGTGNYSPIPNNFNTNADNPNELAKKIQNQISLNTCQGCHGGASKTNFTQIYPRGYGESANYWSVLPDYVSYDISATGNYPVLDDRLEVTNAGTTLELTNNQNLPNSNTNEKLLNQKNQVVAPFLTGRKLSSVNPATGLHDGGNYWEDDELNNNINANAHEGIVGSNSLFSDEKLTGSFYVNDLSNESSAGGVNTTTGKGGNFPQLHAQRWGFNELQRRQDDLCLLVKNSCTGVTRVSLSDLLRTLSFVPLPVHSH